MFSSDAIATLCQKLIDLWNRTYATISTLTSNETGKIYSLPLELELDILLRVSRKQLERCKSVSKNWRDLISTVEFDRAYKVRHRLYERPESSFLIFGVHSFIAVNVLNNGLTTRRLKKPDRRLTGFDLIGSCNGLVCFRTRVVESSFDHGVETEIYRFSMYNPETGAYKVVPELKTYLSLGNTLFCYDRLKQDYNICGIFRRFDVEFVVEICIYIYSSNANLWKFKPLKMSLSVSESYEFDPMIVYRNSIYCSIGERFSNSPFAVGSFDLSSERPVLAKVPIPDMACFYSRNRWDLTTLGGQLHFILVKSRPLSTLEIWRMKKDESWTKLFYCALSSVCVNPLFRGQELVYAHSRERQEILVGPKNFVNAFVRCNLATQEATFAKLEADSLFAKVFGCRVISWSSYFDSHIDC